MNDRKRAVRYGISFVILAVLLIFLFIWNVNSGSIHLSVKEILNIIFRHQGDETSYNIVWEIRLPRILAVIILGGALSVSGFLLQTFFNNPIAGPFVLGISSGAKLIVALLMIFFLSRSVSIGSGAMILAAFAGSMISMGFVLLIAEQYGPERQQTANRLSQTYTDTLYQDLKAEAPDVQLEDVYTDLYLYTSTVQDLADLEPGDGNLRLTVTLFGPYTSADDFAKDCRAVADVVQKQAVQPNAVTFRCDAPLPADSTVRENLDSASAPQTQDYLLEVFGTTQLDWTAEQMARQTEVSGLLDEENADSDEAEEAAEETEAPSSMDSSGLSGTRSD